MRDFFINLFERLVDVIVILMMLAVVAGTVMTAIGSPAAMAPGMGPMGQFGGGPGAALLVFIVGMLYVIFFSGLLYLGLGIYQNTRRMAEAMDHRP
ncbi:hypothetical protein [Histidinibacterium aquaticum]|uniref:Uncharacterized protein n=1 Tax=Histidinibacterium aquaticum TaxID=2613962 RepID=A0A5J5GQV1_9RHOB|nr:hypothetical protein [Histidinibacterium aquaticum]KAA9010570.1 hypothetical protein F3S47_04850 [Histidinibacterium aquaticum]